MKNIYFIGLIILSILCYGCGNKTSTEVTAAQEKTEVVEMAAGIDDNTVNIPYNKRHNNRNTFIIKTYVLNDYIFLYRYCYKLDNVQVTVMDKDGKLLALAGNAQQSPHLDNFIRYLYDKDGNHIGFARRASGHHYPENIDRFNLSCPYGEYIDYLYYDICVRKYDDRDLVRYMFLYDTEGVLRGIYDPIFVYTLSAPNGTYVNWRVEEGVSFWESDIRGGKYYLMFYIMPIGVNFEGNNFIYDVYDGYSTFDYEGDDGQY